MSLQAVLFDVHGTILYTELFHREAVRKVFQEHSTEILDLDELQAYAGLPYQDRFTHMLTMRGIDDDALVESLAQQAEKVFTEQYTVHHAMVPGAYAWVHTCHSAGLALAVVSSLSHAHITSLLTELKILGAFSAIIGREDSRMHKPHPEPYAVALERLSVSAHNSVAFEDSPAGVESAVLAGIPVIGLTTTYSEQDLIKAHAVIPDYTALTLPELETLLASHT